MTRELNSGEFQYLGETLKNSVDNLRNKFLRNRQAFIDPEEIAEEVLENKSAKEQLDILFSAVVSGKENVFEAIIEYGNPDIFSEEMIEKIFDAVIDLSAEMEPDTRESMEKNAQNFAESAGIDLRIKA